MKNININPRDFSVKGLTKDIFLLLVVLFFGGCAVLDTFTEHGEAYKKAEEYYKAGNLDEAVRNCIIALSAKPSHKKASLFLKELLPKVYEMHMNRAKQYTDWDSVISEYDAILNLSERVSFLKGNYPTVDIQEIAERKKYAIQKAAEAHYSKGLLLMEEKRYKEALGEFKESQHFIQGYKNSESLYEKCRALAVTTIAIIPFENMMGKAEFEDIGTLIADKSINIASFYKPDLIDFITSSSLDQLMADKGWGKIRDIKNKPDLITKTGKFLNIHVFVFGKIDLLRVEYSPPTKMIYLREDVVKAGEYSYKVNAHCTHYTKKGEVTIDAEYQIFSVANSSIIKSGRLKTNNVVSEVKWAEYEGDGRALTSEDKSLCSRGEGTVEPKEVLIDKAVKEISNNLATELIEFFKVR